MRKDAKKMARLDSLDEPEKYIIYEGFFSLLKNVLPTIKGS